MTKEKKHSKAIAATAVAATGGLAAFAATYLLSDVLGPLGTAGVASAVSDVTRRTLADFADRLLSARQEHRVKATFIHARERIRYNLDAGYLFRNDDFFSEDETGRSDADEILEAVLLKAKNETEEKKAKHLGNIFANVAFRGDVPKTLANFCIRTAEGLSYQQFCFLALVANEGVLDAEALRRDHLLPDLEVLRREEMSLHTTDIGTIGLIKGTGPWTDALSPLGQVFHDLAALSEISADDLTMLRRKIELCGLSPARPT